MKTLFLITLLLPSFLYPTNYPTKVTTADILNLVNAERTAAGETPLKLNACINAAAQAKADDMATRGYFGHVDPEGRNVWHLFAEHDYDYWIAGENLAIHYKNTEDVVSAWMNSEGHRNNLLNPHFEEMGIGITNVTLHDKPVQYIVQLFAFPKGEACKTNN
jgi:uncharacterized protein YkwD